jgi:hypothetical protein
LNSTRRTRTMTCSFGPGVCRRSAWRIVAAQQLVGIMYDLQHPIRMRAIVRNPRE